MHKVPIHLSSTYENRFPQEQPQLGTYAAMLQGFYSIVFGISNFMVVFKSTKNTIQK